MAADKAGRRMTLRELLSYVNKCSRELSEQYRSTLASRLYEMRDLSRPVRRRSRYPTMLAVQNALKKLQEASDEAHAMGENLYQHLEEIRERCRRERMSH